MQFKLKVYGIIFFGVVCFSCGWYFRNPKTKEVEKVVYKEHAEVKTNISQVISKKENIKSDGSKIIETIITTNTNSDKKSDIIKITDPINKKWLIGVTFQPSLIRYQPESTIINVNYNIVSDLYLGVSISTQKNLGFSFYKGF